MKNDLNICHFIFTSPILNPDFYQKRVIFNLNHSSQEEMIEEANLAGLRTFAGAARQGPPSDLGRKVQ